MTNPACRVRRGNWSETPGTRYPLPIEPLAENLASINQRIATACAASGRQPDDVTLIAVSKNHPVEAIQALYELGHRNFGESRLQEAEPKIAQLPKDITWHFIGKLQSNKTRRVAALFNVLHTLESISQLKELGKVGSEVGVLIEVNLAKEEQKSGIFTENLDEFHKMVLDCPYASFRGLMTIGPALDNPEAMRPYFKRLRELNERVGGQWLSMGMSADFEVAIQEGASHVRVGTGIFGSRN